MDSLLRFDTRKPINAADKELSYDGAGGVGKGNERRVKPVELNCTWSDRVQRVTRSYLAEREFRDENARGFVEAQLRRKLPVEESEKEVSRSSITATTTIVGVLSL